MTIDRRGQEPTRALHHEELFLAVGFSGSPYLDRLDLDLIKDEAGRIGVVGEELTYVLSRRAPGAILYFCQVEPEQESHNTLEAVEGRMVLDLDQILLTVDDADVSLTATEFRLLSIFMLNPNIVHDKADLLYKCWEGKADHIGPNIVETYVKYLRTKLGEKFGKTIETRRGFGYVFNNGPLEEE